MQPAQPSSPERPPQDSLAGRRWDSPQKLFLVLVATIFTAELLVMSALHFLAIPALIEILIDSLVLVLLLMPLLLRRVVYPMRSKIEALAEAEQSLRKSQNELEQRVLERTESLSQANEALQHEIAVRTRMQEELQRLATTDALTGLRNRRAFDAFAAHEINRAERTGDALSIILFDIDYFKQINDNFGHHIGDEVLIGLAQLIGGRLRASEILARWGGEEFIMLLPQTDIENAVHLAGVLRRLMEANEFPQVGKVTASFGVTQFSRGDSMDSMLQRADTALYRAKENGRNRVEGEACATPS
jgi:diguanylate cyclase (GGDEF)-like protein